MATGQIRWVPETLAGQTQHDKELEKSAQRAHSARVGHLKRRKKRIALLQNRASFAPKSEITYGGPSGTTWHIIPSPLMSRGSSDPFDALALPHTPEVNRIVAFMRDAYIPCIYIPTWLRQSPDADLPLSTLVRSRALAGSCGVLRDHQMWHDNPEIQPAWLAGNLSGLMDILSFEDKPRMYEIMLQCRQRGIQILRQSIYEQTKSKSAPKVTLLWQIMLLYREGLIRDHSQGVEAYSVVLQYVEKAYVDNATALNVLIMAMFNDADAACKKLRRTILDFENWLAQRYRPFWTYAETYLPPAPAHILSNLHPSLANADNVIYGAISRTRRCLDLAETTNCLTMQFPEDDFANDLRWGWVASTGLHDMGLLVNQYCDLIDKRHHLKDQPDLWNNDLRIAVTLTTLFNLRKLVQSGSCNGVDLREAPLIIPTMERILKRALKNATKEQQWEARDVLMWMFFSGAWHGQNIQHQQRCGIFGARPTSSGCRRQYDATWFNKQLSMQAHTIWLTRWSDARDFLLRFTYSDLIRPHPSQWYENTVESHKSSELDGSREEANQGHPIAERTSKLVTSEESPLKKRRRGAAPIEDLINKPDEADGIAQRFDKHVISPQTSVI